MNVQERRRRRLLRWADENGVPPKERSLFSQIKSGTTTIGEKLARRLEREYRLGDGYLDFADEGEAQEPPPEPLPPTLKDVAELIALYGQLPADYRPMILNFIRDQIADLSSPRTAANNNK